MTEPHTAGKHIEEKKCKDEPFTNQHVAIFNVEVQKEEEGDEEAEERNSGAFPQTSHLVQGFPHQPHSRHAVTEICTRRTRQKTHHKCERSGFQQHKIPLAFNLLAADCWGIDF